MVLDFTPCGSPGTCIKDYAPVPKYVSEAPRPPEILAGCHETAFRQFPYEDAIADADEVVQSWVKVLVPPES